MNKIAISVLIVLAFMAFTVTWCVQFNQHEELVSLQNKLDVVAKLAQMPPPIAPQSVEQDRMAQAEMRAQTRALQEAAKAQQDAVFQMRRQNYRNGGGAF